jgi:hypothetical protein
METYKIFENQISGHNIFLKYNKAVCKETKETELNFYKNINQECVLSKYIPRFLDIVDPSIFEDKIEGENNTFCKKLLERHKEQKSKFKKITWIKLEDITYNYTYPSIIDLKLGTRQHSINSSQKKIESFQKKINSSTSGSLGVRINGYQLYDVEKKEYIKKDKYYGQKIKKENFDEELQLFFTQKNFPLLSVIKEIAKQLNELYKILKINNDYIFISTSLLIVYDANLNNDNDYKPVLKLIDFGKTIIRSDKTEYVDIKDDSGILIGIESLLNSFSNIISSFNK